MVAQAIGTARAAGGQILVRGDSAYGNRAVVAASVRHGAQFSLVMTRNAAIERAIAAIDADAWAPVRYPGAVIEPDTGEWICDAEGAEVPGLDGWCPPRRALETTASTEKSLSVPAIAWRKFAASYSGV